MTKQIAAWACLGFLVAGFWGFYFANADKGSAAGPFVDVLARVTQPIVAVVVSNVHSPIGLFWVVVMNGATYAFVGLLVVGLARK